MAALQHQKRTIKDDPYWVVLGPHGAISWQRIRGEIYGPIGIHSPRPLYAHYPDMPETPIDCLLLEMPCFNDASFLAGDDLGRKWEAANRDDQIIWAELEDWYRARLAALHTTTNGQTS